MGSPSLSRQAAPSRDGRAHPHLPQPCVLVTPATQGGSAQGQLVNLRTPGGEARKINPKRGLPSRLLAPAFGTPREACQGPTLSLLRGSSGLHPELLFPSAP